MLEARPGPAQPVTAALECAWTPLPPSREAGSYMGAKRSAELPGHEYTCDLPRTVSALHSIPEELMCGWHCSFGPEADIC
jgi:hypothetical protein